MTPFEMGFLIQARCGGDGALADNPMHKDFAARGLEAGVFEMWGPGNEFRYRTTPLGEAWLNACLTVAVPEIRYVDERGRVVLLKESVAM